MTNKEASTELECLAIELTGKLSSLPEDSLGAKYLSRVVDAIDIAQASLKKTGCKKSQEKGNSAPLTKEDIEKVFEESDGWIFPREGNTVSNSSDFFIWIYDMVGKTWWPGLLDSYSDGFVGVWSAGCDRDSCYKEKDYGKTWVAYPHDTEVEC